MTYIYINWLVFKANTILFIIGCWGFVQLGGVIQGFPGKDMLRFKVCKSFIYLKVPVTENKEHLAFQYSLLSVPLCLSSDVNIGP